MSTKFQLWQLKTAVIVYRRFENDEYIVLIFGFENTSANLVQLYLCRTFLIAVVNTDETQLADSDKYCVHSTMDLIIFVFI